MLQAEITLILVSGEKSAQFLNGQLTQDIIALPVLGYADAAYCNRQGQLLAGLQVYRASATTFLLRVPVQLIEIFISKIKPFAVFDRVEFTPQSFTVGCQTGAFWLAERDWQAMRLARGFAVIYPETVAMYYCADFNYIDLDVVNFKKGCYLGQEIVARMYYRGKRKKKLYFLKVQGGLSYNQEIEFEGKKYTVVEWSEDVDADGKVLVAAVGVVL